MVRELQVNDAKMKRVHEEKLRVTPDSVARFALVEPKDLDERLELEFTSFLANLSSVNCICF